ncbi:MAG: DUF2065 domain-containing protein [Zoogloea sp.]|nr:DUF2065 domain-containing protein [Zoogloea sp.]
MVRSLFTAFALMLVLEGILPLVAPAAWKDVFARLARMADGQIRFIGLSSMLLGLVLFTVLN